MPMPPLDQFLSQYLDQLGKARDSDLLTYPMSSEDSPQQAQIQETDSERDDDEDDDDDQSGDRSRFALSDDESGDGDLSSIMSEWELGNRVDPDPEQWRPHEPQPVSQPNRQTQAAGQPQQPLPPTFPNRSPLETLMSNSEQNRQGDVPDFRAQFRDVVEPHLQQMQLDMFSQLTEAMADVQSGLERRAMV